jgi:WD repeat-containing protein 23
MILVGGRLVLRHRKPFTLPFPNSESHPLPRITYSASSKLIRATFGCDPNYPPPSAADPTNGWRSVDYIVAAVPLQKPRSFLENTMAMMSTIGATLSKPQALLANTPGSPVAATFGHDDAAADFALRDDEVMEEERVGGEDDADDSAEPGRPVRVLELPVGWLEKASTKLSDDALRRRQWEVVPLQSHRRRTSGA